MASPTLSDLQLFLRNLFEVRTARLKGSNIWLVYEPALRKHQKDLDALPPALLGPKALAEELAAADALHDGFGGAGYFLLEAYLRLPTASAAVKDAAKRVREAFVPSLSELQISHADEAHRARERRTKLSALEADLRLFPVMAPEGHEKKHPTLYDWFEGQLDAGDKLDALLSSRADKATGSRAAAATLRSSTLGTINRFRTALGDELAGNPKLPADLDAKVFAYFDLLASMRAAGSTEEAPPPPDDPTPSPAPTP